MYLFGLNVILCLWLSWCPQTNHLDYIFTSYIIIDTKYQSCENLENKIDNLNGNLSKFIKDRDN